MAIVDKTEITKSGQEHVSLNWVLNHERFAKTTSSLYRVSTDYFGFFPLKQEAFQLKGLERFSNRQLEQLSNDCNAAYFTDTYGVFSNEWYTGKNLSGRSGIVYGGMSREDIMLLEKMKAKHKLVITEFNTIGSPTSPEIREQFENLFRIKWSGWIGRYFESLDTAANKELPGWLITNYLRQNSNRWPFSKAGVAFVSDKEEVVILEEGTQLKVAVPHIITDAAAQDAYHLPASIKYPFWFDVMGRDSSINEAIAHFAIDANDEGKKTMLKYNIPVSFPAVIQHRGKDYNFYYFCADFCDNPVTLTSSYFKGVSFFKSFFYNEANVIERESFFWKYYRPLVTTILSNQYRNNGD